MSCALEFELVMMLPLNKCVDGIPVVALADAELPAPLSLVMSVLFGPQPPSAGFSCAAAVTLKFSGSGNVPVAGALMANSRSTFPELLLRLLGVTKVLRLSGTVTTTV